MRTHPIGSLRPEHAGRAVTLTGWVARRRDHGGVAFLDLRDASGVAQAVLHDPDAVGDLRPESCVLVRGTVRERPPGNTNPELPTGAVEVAVSAVEVLSPAAPLPIPVDDAHPASEELRLRHRYLDLRRSGPARALRLRSAANRIARELLAGQDFVEVETPTLTRSTPEGARDFLVPVRLRPGSWYALPQSPQLFKQLLMVGGLERYYQLARCYRDEDFRRDRQPEFTQLDIEMSFVDQDDVIAVGEAIVRALWSELAGHEPGDIPRMTYREAMARFGTDKPDLRFGVELTEVTAVFADTAFRVFQAPYVGAVVMPGGATQTRKELDGWQEFARARGARGLAYVVLDAADASASGPVARNLSPAELAALVAATGAGAGDVIFLAAGERASSQALLGAARVEIADRGGLVDPAAWAFTWVIDAPMFEPDGAGGWTAVHHPFTAPAAAWAGTFDEDPGEALAYAYDIVCNGNEIGGGSIRIHRAEMQSRVFEVLGISAAEAQEKFGFLLEAFQYGPPPHGGIAFGWDRVCMLLAGEESLREVIAFPKTGGGHDPLTGAPTPITAAQRREAGVDSHPGADPSAAAAGDPAGPPSVGPAPAAPDGR